MDGPEHAPRPPPRPRCLIIGGQFAGLRCRHLLASAFDVTVIDGKTWWEYTPGLPRALVTPDIADSLLLPHKRDVLCGIVVDVKVHPGEGW